MFGFVRQSTYDADITREKARTERVASKWADVTEKLDTANTTIEHKDAEIDGLSIALRAAEKQLGAANAKLACLTTRGPGGRFVKVDSAGTLINAQPAPAASLGAL